MNSVQKKSASLRETGEITKTIILLGREKKRRGALVFALSGPLGSGKTSIVKHAARMFGIPKKKVTSPTFVLIKRYPIARWGFSSLFHADAYRIKNKREFEKIGFKTVVQDKNAVVFVEWAENIKTLIPKDAVAIRTAHGKNAHERIVTVL